MSGERINIMGKGAPLKVLGVVLDLVQAALAILLIALVTWKMMRVRVDRRDLEFDTRCLLDGSGGKGAFNGMTFCVYAVIVGLVSLIAKALLACLGRCVACVTAGACGIKDFFSIATDVLLAVWWGIAFALFVQRGIAANDRGFPEETARNGIIATAFGALLSFSLDIVFTVCGLTSSN